MTIYLNVFGPFVEDRILCNMKSLLIVTKKMHGFIYETSHSTQEGFNPAHSGTTNSTQDMVPCFFIFQAIRERPIIIRKPVKDHLVKGQAPQCEAQKA